MRNAALAGVFNADIFELVARTEPAGEHSEAHAVLEKTTHYCASFTFWDDVAIQTSVNRRDRHDATVGSARQRLALTAQLCDIR